MDITLNKEQQLYVFNHGESISCRGFQSLFDETNALAMKLKQPDLKAAESEFGLLSVYEKNRQLIALAAGRDLGTWFNPNTPKKICKILETARKGGERLRLFYGDTQSGRDWMESNDVLGTIGRSMGVLKIPLMISDGEYGGPGLLDHCIVRIIRVSDQKELYRHPKYHHGKIDLVRGEHAEYVMTAKVDGKVHARFKTEGEAYHWAAFITGEVMQSLH